MDIEQIDEIIEALLFVSGNGISISEITDLLELQKSEVNHAVNRLKGKYSGKCGILLLSYNGKIQFGSNSAYADVIASVLNPIKEKELSAAALETIAVIAYKQPVTRLDIEAVRGVNCDYALQVLLKHNLIEVVGRKDVVGKPLLFGTTENFLKRFQIENLSQLPDYEELLNNIKVLEDKQKTQSEKVSLYNEFEIPNEEVAATADNSDENNVTVNADEQAKTNTLISEQDKNDLPEEEIPDFLANEKDLQKIN